LRARGPLPIADVVEWVTQACDAIGEAHRMGIVHRDLKPSNLFLTHKNDGTPLVKVLDFGISKAAQQTAALEGTLTTSRTLIGSPMYMSPEQIRDPKAVDSRSDIWSLGIILHQLLTGKPAFSADSLPGVCAAIAADPPASTRERRPEVPEALERVIQKCLEKRPDARYQSVESLCAALAPFGHRAQPGSARGVELAPTERPELDRSSAEAPTISHGRLNRELVAPSAPSDAPLAATQRSAEKTRRRWVVPAALAAFVALAIAALALWPKSGLQPAGVEPIGRPASFVLRIESEPERAEVFDGERLLGTAPFEIRLENAALERAERQFTLRLAGRLPYVVTQGPSASDTTVRGRLAPMPEPAPTEAASAAAPEATTAGPGSRRPPAGKPAIPAPASTGTDIRLER
jgi:serine/threonine-protein kinase